MTRPFSHGSMAFISGGHWSCSSHWSEKDRLCAFPHQQGRGMLGCWPWYALMGGADSDLVTVFRDHPARTLLRRGWPKFWSRNNSSAIWWCSIVPWQIRWRVFGGFWLALEVDRQKMSHVGSTCSVGKCEQSPNRGCAYCNCFLGLLKFFPEIPFWSQKHNCSHVFSLDADPCQRLKVEVRNLLQTWTMTNSTSFLCWNLEDSGSDDRCPLSPVSWGFCWIAHRNQQVCSKIAGLMFLLCATQCLIMLAFPTSIHSLPRCTVAYMCALSVARCTKVTWWLHNEIFTQYYMVNHWRISHLLFKTHMGMGQNWVPQSFGWSILQINRNLCTSSIKTITIHSTLHFKIYCNTTIWYINNNTCTSSTAQGGGGNFNYWTL